METTPQRLLKVCEVCGKKTRRHCGTKKAREKRGCTCIGQLAARSPEKLEFELRIDHLVLEAAIANVTRAMELEDQGGCAANASDYTGTHAHAPHHSPKSAPRQQQQLFTETDQIALKALSEEVGPAGFKWRRGKKRKIAERQHRLLQCSMTEAQVNHSLSFTLQSSYQDI
jgi:hypothetical protein